MGVIRRDGSKNRGSARLYMWLVCSYASVRVCTKVCTPCLTPSLPPFFSPFLTSLPLHLPTFSLPYCARTYDRHRSLHATLLCQKKSKKKKTHTRYRIVSGNPLLGLSEVLHAFFQLLCHRQRRLSRVFRIRLCKFAVVQA